MGEDGERGGSDADLDMVKKLTGCEKTAGAMQGIYDCASRSCEREGWADSMSGSLEKNEEKMEKRGFSGGRMGI